MKKQLCIIYNFAQKYRTAIFQKLDKEFDCKWIFGDNQTDIKGMDTSSLKSVKLIKNIKFLKKPLYYQLGAVKAALFGSHDVILMLSEATAVSTYIIALLKPILAPNKKLYFWSHGYYGKESWWKRKIYKFRFNLADGTFLYGNRAKKLMIEDGINQSKLFVIHNSLDHENQFKLRSRIHCVGVYNDVFSKPYPVLIFVGRLTQVKRLDLLLQAVNELKIRNQYYNVFIIGDGETRSDLERLTKEFNIESQVYFYGACYNDQEMAQFIYEADLCVAPGNVGLTAMHSMVFGTPVLTHNEFSLQMPEFEAIHEDWTGAFFEYNNVHSLANEIEGWFERNQNKREEIRHNCCDEIDRFWTPEFQIEVIKKNLIC